MYHVLRKGRNVAALTASFACKASSSTAHSRRALCLARYRAPDAPAAAASILARQVGSEHVGSARLGVGRGNLSHRQDPTVSPLARIVGTTRLPSAVGVMASWTPAESKRFSGAFIGEKYRKGGR